MFEDDTMSCILLDKKISLIFRLLVQNCTLPCITYSKFTFIGQTYPPSRPDAAIVNLWMDKISYFATDEDSSIGWDIATIHLANSDNSVNEHSDRWQKYILINENKIVP